MTDSNPELTGSPVWKKDPNAWIRNDYLSTSKKKNKGEDNMNPNSQRKLMSQILSVAMLLFLTVFVADSLLSSEYQELLLPIGIGLFAIYASRHIYLTVRERWNKSGIKQQPTNIGNEIMKTTLFLTFAAVLNDLILSFDSMGILISVSVAMIITYIAGTLVLRSRENKAEVNTQSAKEYGV